MQRARHSLLSRALHSGSHLTFVRRPEVRPPIKPVVMLQVLAMTAAGAPGPHDAIGLSASCAMAVTTAASTGLPAAQALSTAFLQGQAGRRGGQRAGQHRERAGERRHAARCAHPAMPQPPCITHRYWGAAKRLTQSWAVLHWGPAPLR